MPKDQMFELPFENDLFKNLHKMLLLICLAYKEILDSLLVDHEKL
jgi:hypothetical protein